MQELLFPPNPSLRWQKLCRRSNNVGTTFCTAPLTPLKMANQVEKLCRDCFFHPHAPFLRWLFRWSNYARTTFPTQSFLRWRFTAGRVIMQGILFPPLLFLRWRVSCGVIMQGLIFPPLPFLRWRRGSGRVIMQGPLFPPPPFLRWRRSGGVIPFLGLLAGDDLAEAVRSSWVWSIPSEERDFISLDLSKVKVKLTL